MKIIPCQLSIYSRSSYDTWVDIFRKYTYESFWGTTIKKGIAPITIYNESYTVVYIQYFAEREERYVKSRITSLNHKTLVRPFPLTSHYDYLEEQSRPSGSNITSATVSFVLQCHWFMSQNLSKIRNGQAPEMVQ